MEEIDKFENYMETSKVTKSERDLSKAKGLIEMAKADMKQVLEREVDEESSSFIFKNAYEVIRSAVTADMAKKGYNPYSHTVVVAYGRDVLELSTAQVTKLNRFRKLRNNICYRAEKPTVKETEEILGLMNKIVEEIDQNRIET